MRIPIFIFTLAMFGNISEGLAAASESKNTNLFQSKISPIPSENKKLMEQYTWHEGCPVSLENLAYVELTYWGFDHKSHRGVLIIHKKLAKEAVNIFHELYDEKFPIERMEPMYVFKGDARAAMAANNTFAFMCSKNNENIYSIHSYGYAIDINSLINPYLMGNQVFPPNGKAYLNRSKPVPGMIIIGDKTYQTFTDKGWTWGGSRTESPNYQHFEKDCSKNGTCTLHTAHLPELIS